MAWYNPMYPQLPLTDNIIRIGSLTATGNLDSYLCAVYYDQFADYYIIEHRVTFDNKSLPFNIPIVGNFIRQYNGDINEVINSIVVIVENKDNIDMSPDFDSLNSDS